MYRITIIGGAGDMAQVAAGAFVSLIPDCRLVLADYNREKAEKVAGNYDPSRAEAAFVDIYDPDVLREVIRGSDLVANCTGPYYRTGRPVVEACMHEKVDYIDLGDDEESALELLAMHEKAREAGITALICCGVAPGLVNVIARECAQQLDEVDSIDLAWVTGSTPPKEGKEKGGAAVFEHMVHACMGKCGTIRDGKRVEIPSFRIGHDLEFPQPLGTCRLFELGHAEVATMPRYFPGVKTVRTMGSLYPPYFNGVFRGIAGVVDRGKVEMKDAVTFLLALDRGENPRGLRLYMGVLGGVLAQLLRRELKARDFFSFLGEVAGKRSQRSIGAVLVAVEGVKDGRMLRIQASHADYQGGSEGNLDMDDWTGTPLAVFASMLLDGSIEEKGVMAPEACVDPAEFTRRMTVAMPITEEAIGLEIKELA
ncbi:MAG: saccharopine dehydrogenase NADP-binding domain-containing protein [Actinobacteria bacterium]|nr:saccharopine dehydrogenase NADP-binding domain-containing protein [Actinomycetota bacterium]